MFITDESVIKRIIFVYCGGILFSAGEMCIMKSHVVVSGQLRGEINKQIRQNICYVMSVSNIV